MRTSFWTIGLLVALRTTAAAQSARAKVDMSAARTSTAQREA